MKFKKKWEEQLVEHYKDYYISYDYLKKAIKLVCGENTSDLTLSEVICEFGNSNVFKGAAHRPIESRFQELINLELRKINKFASIEYHKIAFHLQEKLRFLISSPLLTVNVVKDVFKDLCRYSGFVEDLHSYVQLNLVGFTRITRKFEKYHKRVGSYWCMTEILKEAFTNLNFNYLVEIVSACFSQLRSIRRSISKQQVLHTTAHGHEESSNSGIEPFQDDSDSFSDASSEERCQSERSSGCKTSLSEETAKYTGISKKFESTAKNNKSPFFTTKFLLNQDNLMATKLYIARYLQVVPFEKTKHFSKSHYHAYLLSNFEILENGAQEESKTDPEYRINVSVEKEEKTGQRNNSEKQTHSTVKVEKNFLTACAPYQRTMGCLYFDCPDSLEAYRSCLSCLKEGDHNKVNNIFRIQWTYKSSSDMTDKPGKLMLSKGESPVVMRPNAVHTGKTRETDADEVADKQSMVRSDNYSIRLDRVDVIESAEGELCWSEARKHDSPLNKNGYPFLQLEEQDANSVIRGDVAFLNRKTHNFECNSNHELIELTKEVFHLVSIKRFSPLVQKWFTRSIYAKDLTCSGRNWDNDFCCYIDENIRFSRMTIDTKNFWKLETQMAWICHGNENEVTNFKGSVLTVSYKKRPKFLIKLSGMTLARELWGYNSFVHGVSVVYRKSLSKDEIPLWWKLVMAPSARDKPRGKTDSKYKRFSNQSSKSDGLASEKTFEDMPGRDLEVTGFSSMADPAFVALDMIGMEPKEKLRHDHAAGSNAQLQRGDYFSSTKGVGVMGNRVPTQSVRCFTGLDTSSTSFKQPLLLNYKRENNILPPSASHLNLKGLYLKICGALMCCFKGSPLQSIVVPKSSNSFVKVDPKTFFANERTLLQWMNTAVLLSTISITLLNFGMSTARYAGYIIAPVALFFIIYSFLVYIRRSRCLENKKPIKYNDTLGPTILVICLTVGLSSVILLNVFAENDENGSIFHKSTVP